MKKLFAFIAILLVKISLFSTEIKPELDFIKNQGQWENPVLYKTDLKGGWAFLEKDELTYLFYDNSTFKHPHTQEKKEDKSHLIKGHVYKVKWLNANQNVTTSETDKQEYFNNYFVGNDESKWQSNVGLFRAINYTNLYNNIDAKIYSEASSMKTDYIIHPNGNPADIKMKYDGVNKINIDEKGKLKITTSINTVYELKPYAYQIKNGNKVEVVCKYKLTGNTVSFILPNSFNKNEDLIIDPTIIFSTYSGSFGDNWGSSATHDNNGNMFLGGVCLESGFPTTTGAFQTTFGGGTLNPSVQTTGSDVVITKLNATGTSRLYSTYLGGNSNEILESLICTPNNELVAIMATSSTNFPTTSDAYDKSFNGGSSVEAVEFLFPNGSDLAITKFNANGTALIGSTFFGGSGNDGLNLNDPTLFNYGDESRSDVALDNAGNIYVVSSTESSNLPGTAGKAQANYGGGTADGMLAKFNSNLSALSWATYYGGSATDAAYSIGLDDANNIFICGGTTSENIPGRNNGLNSSYLGGSCDGFVAKFDKNGNSVLAATYLGTNAYDQAFIMDLDKSNNVYLFGQTLGAYPVTAGVYSNTNAKQFIHKLNNNLNATGFSTVFGRPNYDLVNISPTALLVDVCSNIYAVGWGGAVNTGNGSAGTGFTFNMPITANALQSTTDGSDFYLINLGQDATSLIYASYLGENNSSVGDHVDGGTSRFDKNGVVYQAICGSCGATQGFPVTAGVVSTTNNSNNCNMVGVKYKFDLQALQIVTTTATPPRGCTPLSVAFSYTSTKPGTSFFWDFGDGTSTTTEFPTHIYTNPGTYVCKFIIRNPQDCNPVDSSFVTVTVLNKITENITRSICQGQSIVFNGQTLTQTGTYRDTITNTQGCDSFIVLSLVVNTPKTTNVTKSICQGQTFTFNGQIISQSGTYRDTLRTSFGCDSFVVLTLSVSSSLNIDITKVICQGQSVTVGQHIYTTTGIYKDTLKTNAGCDSIVTLNLEVNSKKVTNVSQEICEGERVVIGNSVYTTTGNYSDTFATNLNCDSIVHLNLIVNPKKFSDLSLTICAGKSVTIGGQTFTINGDYSIVFESSKGCDSIMNLHLTFSDTIKENITRTICEGDTLTIENQQFTQAGNYTINLKAVEGCDSVVNLNLLVLNVVRESIQRTICEGQTTTVGTETFSEAGNYTVKLTSAAGCDSIVLLELIVNSKKSTRIDSTVCQGERVTIGNHSYLQTGNYIDTLKSSQGCDSIVHLSLTVNPLPIIDATVDKPIVEAGEQVQLNVSTTETLTYNWTPGTVSNANIQNPTAIVNAPTWFVVQVSNNNTLCKNSDSVFVDLKIIPCTKENVFIPTAFSPNGDGNNDVFLVRSKALASGKLMIFDRWGNKVFESDDITIGWNGTYKNQPAQLEVYGYYFVGKCLEGNEIKLKGNVTLVR